MFYVYILKLNSSKKNYYIGYTSNLKKRLSNHLEGKSKSTKNRNPELIYYEAYNDKLLALRRERGIKSSGSVYMGLIKRLKLE